MGEYSVMTHERRIVELERLLSNLDARETELRKRVDTLEQLVRELRSSPTLWGNEPIGPVQRRKGGPYNAIEHDSYVAQMSRQHVAEIRADTAASERLEHCGGLACQVAENGMCACICPKCEPCPMGFSPGEQRDAAIRADYERKYYLPVCAERGAMRARAEAAERERDLLSEALTREEAACDAVERERDTAIRLFADDLKREELAHGLNYCISQVLERWQGASDDCERAERERDNLRQRLGAKYDCPECGGLPPLQRDPPELVKAHRALRALHDALKDDPPDSPDSSK
jgi:hypothetical protein